MKKIYNENENNFSELMKDLKNLPKINAPENFDLNLMTKIQNKNFSKIEEKRPQFNWIKFLTPSAAVVTAIILFFIFLPASQQDSNPGSKDAQKIVNQDTGSNTTAVENKNPDKKNEESIISNSTRVIDPNQPASTAKVKFPINNPRAIRLDDYISGVNENQKDLSRGNVVSSGDAPAEFDGFYFSEKPDKITLEKYRARLDSIKKAQAKADSLKKVRK